jgi:hypothetical protein
MAKIKPCKECGVPFMVSKGHTWNSNGVLTQADNPDNRMTFYEANNFVGAFGRLAGMIGMPIDKIIVESKRREAKEYVEKMLSPLARRVARTVGVRMVADNLSKTGRTLGFGDVGLVGFRRKGNDDDYITLSVKGPHVIQFLSGETLGAWEAIDGRECNVTFEEKGDNQYHITCRVGSHPVELKERLQFRDYQYKPGDIDLKRCPSCGVPLDVAYYNWDLAEGTVRHPETGRRMAIVGPRGVEAIIDDLAAELGQAIPATVVEAQRQHVKQAMKDDDWKGAPTDYRQALAFRGLGNLTHFGGRREHLEVVIENACMPLMTVGFIQAFYELALGYEQSRQEHEFTADGVLKVGIKAID